MTKQEQIMHLKEYAKKWEMLESDFLENGQEPALIEEHTLFCKENGLPHICALELLHELMD
jgi:hypothetical protein